MCFPTRFIALKPSDRETLADLVRGSLSHRVRSRSQALLWSDEGKTMREIAELCTVQKATVSSWFDRWENGEVEGLSDRPKSGRPPLIAPELEVLACEAIEKTPHSPATAHAVFCQSCSLDLSRSAWTAFLHRQDLTYKRTRRSLRPFRDQEEFDRALHELSLLTQRHHDKALDLVYFDEAGFNLQPSLPYAWSKKGKRIEIPSKRSRSQNVLGFMHAGCERFQAYSFEGSIDSGVVVDCFNRFAKTLDKETWVVIDNAPVHTSWEFLDELDVWERMGLHVFNLPTYSPELNLIEILWKKIKYEWMPLSAYTDLGSLKFELSRILGNIGEGQEYHCNFAATPRSRGKPKT